jgi:hypothetical protein
MAAWGDGTIRRREDCVGCASDRATAIPKGAYFANLARYHANVILFDKGSEKEQLHQSDWPNLGAQNVSRSPYELVI